MEKDFREWHGLKTDLQRTDRNILFHEREIWLCSVGMNLGHEEDGKSDLFLRPVVIFRRFYANACGSIALTSTLRMGSYYYQFYFGGRISTAMLFQMRLFDQKRFIRKMGVMPSERFNEMKARIEDLMP